MLQIVLAINVAMFVVELVSGLVAGSTALLADSVDMLGDAVVYSFSLYVVCAGSGRLITRSFRCTVAVLHFRSAMWYW